GWGCEGTEDRPPGHRRARAGRRRRRLPRARLHAGRHARRSDGEGEGGLPPRRRIAARAAGADHSRLGDRALPAEPARPAPRLPAGGRHRWRSGRAEGEGRRAARRGAAPRSGRLPRGLHPSARGGRRAPGAEAGVKPAALAFAPHSGWAAVIALGGPGPALLYRGRVEMADSALPGAPQPYHALEGLPPVEAERGLARYQASAAKLARAGLRQVLSAVEEQGYAPRAVGILASSGRQGGSLAAILAAHPLIHT